MYVYENDRAQRKEFLIESKWREVRPRRIRRKSMRERHVKAMDIESGSKPWGFL